jgi:hypothetical protein
MPANIPASLHHDRDLFGARSADRIGLSRNSVSGNKIPLASKTEQGSHVPNEEAGRGSRWSSGNEEA